MERVDLGESSSSSTTSVQEQTNGHNNSSNGIYVLADSSSSVNSRRNSITSSEDESFKIPSTTSTETTDYKIYVETEFNSESFFPGQVLLCKIDIYSSPSPKKSKIPNNINTNTNSSQSQTKSSSSSSSLKSNRNSGTIGSFGKDSGLDWISVQVCGHYILEPSWIKIPIHNNSQVKKMTDLNLKHLANKPENKYIIFCTPANVLGCEISLLPIGTMKSYVFQCILPYDLPPSFKLTGIRCGYSVIISAQKGLAQPKVITFPFRVISPGCAVKKLSFVGDHFSKFNFLAQSKEIEDSLDQWPTIQKKLLMIPIPAYNDLNDPSLINIENIVTSIYEQHSNTVCMNITRGNNHLVKFSLNKTAFKLGDSIKGSFDFDGAMISCLQLSVRLETEQTIESTFCNPVRSSKSLRSVIFEHHQLTHNTMHTSFFFPIPVESIQEFTSDILSLHWHLQFEFIILKSSETSENMDVRSTSPRNNQIKVDVLTWSYPVRIIVPQHPAELIYKPNTYSSILFDN